MRNNDVDPASDEVGRNLVQPLFMPIRPEIFDRNGAALTPAELAQPLRKRGDPMLQCGSRTSAKEPDGAPSQAAALWPLPAMPPPRRRAA